MAPRPPVTQGVVRIALKSLGELRVDTLRMLVRRLLPAHLVVEIYIQDKPLVVPTRASSTEEKVS